MRNRIAAVALGTSALLAPVALMATASAAPGTPAAPGARVADDGRLTLREMAPEGFEIGTAVAGGGHHVDQPYPDPFPNDQEYRQVMAREFSSLSPENQMKWEFIHPEEDSYRWAPADRIVRFAERNGQVVRGHTLLWHSQNPEWLEEGDFTAPELRKILRNHIFAVVGRYRGQIQQWDVANEIFDESGNYRTEENIWIRELGPGIVAQAFRWAHRADPEAKLFFNDYGVEDPNPKSDAYYELVQQLQADGVPVDGFSVQGHLSMQYDAPSRLEENLQRFADLGLETAVTEIDVRMVVDGAEPTTDQLQEQADYYRQVLGDCLDVEGCNSFTVWGFTDKYSWVPVFFPTEGEATIMTEELEKKPSYHALLFRLAEARASR
jgi:endo-1,4-beta-xylanase